MSDCSFFNSQLSWRPFSFYGAWWKIQYAQCSDITRPASFHCFWQHEYFPSGRKYSGREYGLMAFRCSIQREFQQLYLPTGNPTVHLPPHPSSVHHRRACSDSSSGFWESKTPPADCISIHIYPCHRKRPADSVDTAHGSTRSWCHNLHRFVPRLWYEK